MQNNKIRKQRHWSAEQYQKIRQAETELSQRIRDTGTNLEKRDFPSILTWIVGIVIVSAITAPLIYIIWLFQIPIYMVVVILILFALPVVCKCYGIIVGANTIYHGIKLAFSGSYFPVTPFLPFSVLNPQISSFCLGWGLLVASCQSGSTIGLILGILNLFASGLGIFEVKSSIGFAAPGFLSSGISGILTVILGFCIVEPILSSWKK
jgi:hypothetical protein